MFKFIVALLLELITVLIGGYVTMLLWNWYLAPAFHLLLPLLGGFAVIAILRVGTTNPEEVKDKSWRVLFQDFVKQCMLPVLILIPIAFFHLVFGI